MADNIDPDQIAPEKFPPKQSEMGFQSLPKKSVHIFRACMAIKRLHALSDVCCRVLDFLAKIFSNLFSLLPAI